MSRAAAGLAVFLVVTLAQPALARRAAWLTHLGLAGQAALAAALLALPPHPDAVFGLFTVMGLQAAVALPGRLVALWLVGLVALQGGLATAAYGLREGLALAAVPAVGCVALAEFALAYRESEAARAESARLVAALEAAHQRLEVHAAQAEELAELAERQRLARELHDSVSQTVFSLTLHARAARLSLDQHPERLGDQLERLSALAQEALAEIRGLIAELRPTQ
jgi:signal transduction histidine kinase